MKAASDFGNASKSAVEAHMRETTLTVPEIVMIAGTRVAFGAGLGLLLAERLGRETRKGAGLALLTVGALSTIPLVLGILRKSHAQTAPESA